MASGKEEELLQIRKKNRYKKGPTGEIPYEAYPMNPSRGMPSVLATRTSHANTSAISSS